MENNQRQYFRYDLKKMLDCKVKIHKISNKTIESKSVISQLLNIGPGGLSFIARVDFPIRNDVLFQFDIYHDNNEFKTFFGKLVWKNSKNSAEKQYGVEFLINNENERQDVIQYINHHILHFVKT